MKAVWTVTIAALALLGAACGGGDDTAASGSDRTTATEADGGSETDDDTNEAGGDVPDACSLFDVEEISAAIGREVGPGEPENTPDDASSCRFETLVGLSTSTTYDDPAIAESFLGSVTVSTARSSAEEFDELEEMLGDEAEAETGIGDDAYFWGENILYVRVGGRGLTVRIEADEADGAAVRAAVVQLGELGASRL